MDILKRSTQVLIVGAGPTGLLAAIELVKRGISCIIIEKKEERSPFSKALGLHARTLETLELMGLADLFLEKGYPVTGSRLHFGIGKPSKLDFSQLDTPFPYVLVLPQYDTEEILENHLEQLGVEVERHSELIDLEINSEGALAVVNRNGHREQIQANYVLSCDGAHSKVREILKVPFEGNKENMIFFLADAKIKQFNSKGYMNVFMANRGMLFLLPFKNHYTRVIAVDLAKQNRPHSSELSLQELQDSVNNIAPGITLADPVWLSQFGTSHRLVPNYRHGNVFFIGDAAHIHNPAGGQGMNLGLQDVLNLVWKLEFVIKGYSHDSILNTYHEERHFIASQVISATSKMMHVVTLPSPILKRARRIVGKSATSLNAIKNFAVKGLTELKFNYRHSSQAINHYDKRLRKNALQAGDRVPDAYLFSGHSPQLNLFSILKQHPFTCFIYANHINDSNFDQAKKVSKQFQNEFGDLVRTYYILQNGAPSRDENLSTLIDVKNELQKKIGLTDGSIIVFRQDGIVAFHQKHIDLEQCSEKLRFWMLQRSLG
ncbi:pentachlorophenol 4-monooxygenase [Planococcus halocryophilus Or1]|uniref:FAD-binding domain-containing protein n=1 Tax=Planococcus halocryophilus TaxID=1215089 RepID=A0A1C7DP21_9BACL|nr:FAD-dependent monooxygenase [Planococcus halocryophilus]ANU13340.1 hypothetical protein BBI08_05590 [Planococcus halocryophilus]EMF46151.1 pentachlorophenol 4-monooxygenase [Planococcus halocryophilus Or1]